MNMVIDINKLIDFLRKLSWKLDYEDQFFFILTPPSYIDKNEKFEFYLAKKPFLMQNVEYYSEALETISAMHNTSLNTFYYVFKNHKKNAKKKEILEQLKNRVEFQIFWKDLDFQHIAISLLHIHSAGINRDIRVGAYIFNSNEVLGNRITDLHIGSNILEIKSGDIDDISFSLGKNHADQQLRVVFNECRSKIKNSDLIDSFNIKEMEMLQYLEFSIRMVNYESVSKEISKYFPNLFNHVKGLSFKNYPEKNSNGA